MLDIALYAVCKQLINCVNMCDHKIVSIDGFIWGMAPNGQTGWNRKKRKLEILLDFMANKRRSPNWGKQVTLQH